MNHTTGPARAFVKMYALFGFLLIVLAVIAIPCSAGDEVQDSADKEQAGEIAANLVTDQAPVPGESSGDTSNETDTLPTPGWVNAPDVGPAPLTVTFTDTSSGDPAGWAWYFGDEHLDQEWTARPTPPWGSNDTVSAVALSDGTIVVISNREKCPIWRSTDQGRSWSSQFATIPSIVYRVDQPALALSDGSIIVLGGSTGGQFNHNAVWLSTDKGGSWKLQTNTPEWKDNPSASGRYGYAATALPDGSILVMGGTNKNDVWRSTNKGASWSLQTEHAGWGARGGASVVVQSDGSILLMGGSSGSTSYNDTWRSSDQGRTWSLLTEHAGWSARDRATTIVMPDGSILLMSGKSGSNSNNDIWRSTDGKSWTLVTAHASWGERYLAQLVKQPDGSLVLLGGYTSSGTPGVWHLDTAGSHDKNPLHVYTKDGTYRVTLQVSGSGGYKSLTNTTGVRVNPHEANVVIFGNNFHVPAPPTRFDYTQLGSTSAVRRDGSINLFSTRAIEVPGNNWVQVTKDAAIRKDGTLVLWGSGQVVEKTAPQKRYVAISQFCNAGWLLAIYEDEAGLTRLETIANPTEPTDVVTHNLPTGTGWKMISAGYNHALALKSDGSLVSWGDNFAGQLNLPTTVQYADIAAGEGFSLGLIDGKTRMQRKILAAGKDDHGQVTNVKFLGPEYYIQIEAGINTAVALDEHGAVHQWGKNLEGWGVPADKGYTDIALGQDYGLALREPVPELHITGPLSPGTALTADDGSLVPIPRGALFEHTRNNVMRVLDPKGTELLWVNDDEAPHVLLPDNSQFPVSVIHFGPAWSAIRTPANFSAVWTDTSAAEDNNVFMNVTDQLWYDEQAPSDPQTLPMALCAGTDCSVGATSRNQLFLSKPLTPANGGIPVFSVRPSGEDGWVGTLGILGSANVADLRSMVIEKDRVDPGQPLRLYLMKNSPGGMASDSDMFVTATANLTNQSSVLHYTITGTASISIPAMNITPHIWKKTDAGDVLVFVGEGKVCTPTNICTTEGIVTPDGPGTYFTNATISYSLPAGATIPQVVGRPLSMAVTKSDVEICNKLVYVEAVDGLPPSDNRVLNYPLNNLNDPSGVASNFHSEITHEIPTKDWKDWRDKQVVGEDDARENHWKNGTEHAGGKSKDWVDKADFAYFSGHGEEGKFLFSKRDDGGVYRMTAENATWGKEYGSQLKWIVIDSCEALSENKETEWKNAFKGLHILMGHHTVTYAVSSRGTIFPQLLKGTYPTYPTKYTMLDAWEYAGKNTVKDASKYGMIYYVDSCKDDHLPGFSTWNNDVQRESDGKYKIQKKKIQWKVTRPLSPIHNNQFIRNIRELNEDAQNLRLDLDGGKYIINCTLPQIPEKIMVYTPNKPDVSIEWVKMIAQKLGVPGPLVESENSYYYPDSDSYIFLVQKSDRHVYFINRGRYWGSETGLDLPNNLPTDDRAIRSAKIFLQEMNLSIDMDDPLSTHNSRTRISGKNEGDIVWEDIAVGFGPKEIGGVKILGSNIVVDVGTNGDIIGIFTNWKDYSPFVMSPTKPLNTAFEEFKKYPLHSQMESSTENVVITNVSLVYYSQPPAVQEKYLQPIYVFEGYLQSGDTIMEFDPVYIAATDEEYDAIP